MWPKFSLFLLERIRMQRNGARRGFAWNIRSADIAVSTGRAINNSLTLSSLTIVVGLILPLMSGGRLGDRKAASYLFL
jgi:hypothetical protein